VRYISEVDPDAKDHAPRDRTRIVPFGQTFLSGHGAQHRVRHALEDREQAVAGGVDEPAVVFFEVSPKQGEAFGERGDGPWLVLAHQTAVADDVRAQDGGQSAISVCHPAPLWPGRVRLAGV
jgi:hypothetical protein